MKGNKKIEKGEYWLAGKTRLFGAFGLGKGLKNLGFPFRLYLGIKFLKMVSPSITKIFKAKDENCK